MFLRSVPTYELRAWDRLRIKSINHQHAMGVKMIVLCVTVLLIIRNIVTTVGIQSNQKTEERCIYCNQVKFILEL